MIKIKSYTNPWLFEDKIFVPEEYPFAVGFVYLITNTLTNKKYIGKKLLQSTTRKKIPDKKNRKVIRKPSDWQEYYGSSKILLEDIKTLGKEHFKREILSIHESRGDINYHEMKYQVLFDVLNSDEFYNDNILTRWYRRKHPLRSVCSSKLSTINTSKII